MIWTFFSILIFLFDHFQNNFSRYEQNVNISIYFQEDLLRLSLYSFYKRSKPNISTKFFERNHQNARISRYRILWNSKYIIYYFYALQKSFMNNSVILHYVIDLIEIDQLISDVPYGVVALLRKQLAEAPLEILAIIVFISQLLRAPNGGAII